MSATHTRIVVRRHGGPGQLKPETVTTADPAGDGVRIRVERAGVAFGDVLLREGIRREPAPPLVPGYDVAGVVDAVGPDAPADLVGRTVLGWTRGSGGYSQVVITPAWAVVPYDGLDPGAAVSLVLNYVTAYQMLHRVARVREGERILVHGAGGGVGTAVLQLARRLDLEVYGTASRGKHDIVRGLGAIPIDHVTQDPAAVVTRAGGAQAIFDPIGGRSWRASLSALSATGVLVAYGFAAATVGGRRRWRALAPALAASPLISPIALMQRPRSVAGYRIERLAESRPDWFHEDLTTLVDLARTGEIEPVVHGSLPLERAPVAHELLGSAGLAGKLVLTVTQS